MIEARALHPALARYQDGPPSNPRSYPDLHEHILALARENLLVVVDEPINKDTEMHPLVRWQYRGGIGPRGPRDNGESAAVLVNALLKGIYAPVALPKREFMDNAKMLWERLGLPPLKPEAPWHGYDLGHWPRELERQARLAVQSDYFALGPELAKQRRDDVAMNTPVARDVETKKISGPQHE
jgi:hypothetical protein